jgi:hypothetical protein
MPRHRVARVAWPDTGLRGSALTHGKSGAGPEAFGSVPRPLVPIATLTTVGYGDVHPVTIAGRLCPFIGARRVRLPLRRMPSRSAPGRM